MQDKDNKIDVNDDIINIAVTVDDNYIKPLIVMLVSLFNSNWNSKFNIFLIHSDLSDDNLNKVSNLIKLYGQVINIIKLDQSLFEKATSVEHVTKETFYRLLLTEIIPKDIDKILYLDPDIIINGPITKLYNKKFNNKLAIAAEVAADNSRWNNQKRLIGIPIKATYFNAGVLLFNLKLMRKSPIFAKEFMLDYVIKNNKRFVEGDQSCLNALLWDKVIVLNCNIYNYDTRFYYDANKGNFIKFLISNIREQNLASHKSIIMHYRGASKPWQDNYCGKLWNIYWRYEHMTEFKRSFLKNYARYKYNNLREIILILKKIYF